MLSQSAVLVLLALATCSGIVQGQRIVATDTDIIVLRVVCMVSSFVLKKMALC